MDEKRKPDWDPKSPDVTRDQRKAYDEMRRRCPVAYSEFMGWSLFRHEDVSRALDDHKTFSNAARQHLNVPNGMDPPEHTEYRRVIERYFTPERMQAFEPVCRNIASSLVKPTQSRGEIDFMADVALPFAVSVQCAFMGWPDSLRQPLTQWINKSHAATLAEDRKLLSEIALEFEALIDDLLDARLQSGAGPETDNTASLMHEKVWGRRLSSEEVASIVRNWTAGEIGTIAASVGILVHYLAQNAALQEKLRAQRDLLPKAIDEILRIYGPLVSNRRVATRSVEVGGRKIEAGERVTLMWIAANRDERVFGNPDEFRLDRDPKQNLLYGAGIHVCPGAPLASLEMRVFMEELLSRTSAITLPPEKKPTVAVYPASGYSTLPLLIT